MASPSSLGDLSSLGSPPSAGAPPAVPPTGTGSGALPSAPGTLSSATTAPPAAVACPRACSAAATTGSIPSSPAAPDDLALTPLQIAKLGYKQKVVIPMHLMLKKVMASINSPSEPIFNCVKLGESVYVAHVQLDVSSTRFLVGETERIVTIDGQARPNPFLAYDSAARNAFDYLANRHLVFVIDYSKNIAQRNRDKAPFGHVNSVIHQVEDAVDAFHASIARIRNFKYEVHGKELGETNAGIISPAGELYKEAKEFLDSVEKRYEEKYQYYLSCVKAYEDERTKYKDECTERMIKWANQGLRQPGWFTEKDVLEYVLAYFGLTKAEYWNECTNGRHIGYVKIHFGDLDDLNCYGSTVFRGYASSSSRVSEQDAAAAALKEIERIFNVIIVDFNHADRVATEKEHKWICSLLNNIMGLADMVKEQCTDMLHTINSTCGFYGSGPDKFSISPLSNDQVCALSFCVQGLATLQSYIVKKLEFIAAKIEQVQKYYPRE